MTDPHTTLRMLFNRCMDQTWNARDDSGGGATCATLSQTPKLFAMKSGRSQEKSHAQSLAEAMCPPIYK